MSYRYLYHKQYDLDRSRGIERTMDATPVHRHIDFLMAQGATYAIIGAAVGIDRRTMRWMRERTARMNRTTAAKILALDERVMFGPNVPDEAMVPKHGAARRVQALLRIGYTHPMLTERLGTPSRAFVRADNGRVTLRNHRRIVALYDELWMKPGPSKKGVTWAIKNGYVSPLAWNDIDDPNEIPEGVVAA